LRSAHTLLLPLAACVSFALFGSIPGDGVHPFAMAASLLPLQLAALFWIAARRGNECAVD